MERLTPHAPTLVVLEATGGYELAVVAALAAAQLPVVVANPRQVRDVAKATGQKATGQRAKTDRVDAGILALFAERVRPEVRALAGAEVQELDARLTRRRQLLDRLTAERNRLGHAVACRPEALQQRLAAPIAFLTRELQAADVDLGRRIQQRPIWRERDDLLRSVPGVGPGLARTRLAELPE